MSDAALNPRTDVSPAAPLSPPVAAAVRPRLWPVIIILAVQWGAKLLAETVLQGEPAAMNILLFGPMLGTLLILAWWLLLSRVPWRDRLLVFLVIVAGGAVTVMTDIALPAGGMKFAFYALPLALAAGVLWLVVTPYLRWEWRRTGMILAILLVTGLFAVLRFENGMWGDFSTRFVWAWSPTNENRALAEINKRQAPAPQGALEKPLELVPGDWPGFRGAERDGKLHGVHLATDWEKHPPRQLWKQRVGKGWSSFAVVGKRLYTQEQRGKEPRGEDEAVVCYDADTGKEMWIHLDPGVRFVEAIGGIGPRATPTFDSGRLYTLGATGKLNCLDAATGKVIWYRDVAADTGAKVPMWAFASSPLVMNGMVAVFAGGPEGKAVQTYDAATGIPKWAGGKGTHGYCSPEWVTIDGVPQIVYESEQGLSGLDPADGKELWNHEWDLQIQRCVQPTRVGTNDFLLGTTFNKGTRRLHVSRDGDGWKVEQVWETRAISPYFNDPVIYGNHLYGFEGSLLACVNLDNGKLAWKERGYGAGQVLLLADQGVLLVLTETGDIALVDAKPDEANELARIPALDGKTWNHPVIAHGRMYVRNDQWMACYEVKTEGTVIKK